MSSALEDMLAGGAAALRKEAGGGDGGPRAVFEILKDAKPVGEFVMDQTKVVPAPRVVLSVN